MAVVVGRRAAGPALLGVVAVAGLVLGAVGLTAAGRGEPQAGPPSPLPAASTADAPAVCLPEPVPALTRQAAEGATERVVIGASVTQLINRELKRRLPGVVVDARGGRSWGIRATGDGPTLWQAYLARRPTLRAGDWLVLETARGDVPVAVNRACARAVKATLPQGACLAWVIPHEYYGAQTPAMQRWNADTAAAIRSELAGYPCHAVIEWDALVRSYQARATGLTEQQKALGGPLLYDGRHPTPLGAAVLADAIRRATPTR